MYAELPLLPIVEPLAVNAACSIVILPDTSVSAKANDEENNAASAILSVLFVFMFLPFFVNS
jgi:hypothetical protein